MSYLYKIHAADPRPPVRKQAEEKDAAKPKAKEGVFKTGKSLQDKEGRFAEIKQFNPYLFIISGPGLTSNVLKFFKETGNIINDEKNVERIAGPSKISGKSTEPLELTFAYLVSEKSMKELTAKATGGLLAFVEPFDKKMGSASPFKSIKLPVDMESKLGDYASKLRAVMLSSYTKLRDQDKEKDDTLGAISALQMSALIPLDYMRWLTKEHKKHQFYLGGHPDNAGRDGMIYILCSEEESKLFFKTLKEFKPLPNFVDDLHFLSNIDSAFKPLKPREFTPDNCVILEGSEALNPDAKMGTLEEKEKIAAAVTAAPLRPMSQRAQEREEQFPTLKKPDPEAKVLDALTDVAGQLSHIKNIPAGQYVKGTHIQGNLVAHFSADKHKCILWCGKQAINLTKSVEDFLIATFNLKSVNRTFSK